MVTIGTKVRVLKGCKPRGIAAHTTARVTAVRPLGAEFGHSVAVSLQMLNGFKSGTTVTFYARHINRLSDPTTNLNDGNPLHKVVIQGTL